MSGSSIPDLCVFDGLGVPAVSEFDRVFSMMQSTDTQCIMAAEASLRAFHDHPNAFSRAHELIASGLHPQTQFLGLQLLTDTITVFWNRYSQVERDGMKQFIVAAITKQCDTVAHMRANKALVTKMNAALVAIAKREYPARWPTFVADVVAGAEIGNEAMVENTIAILSLFGEDVFEFGTRSLTSKWIAVKRDALASDFGLIYPLCMKVLASANDIELIIICLQCMEKFVPFVPYHYLFHADTLQYITSLSATYRVREPAMKYLTEVAALTVVEGPIGDHQSLLMSSVFASVIANIIEALPTNHSSLEYRIKEVFESGRNEGQLFVNCASLFISTCFQTYLKTLQKDTRSLQNGHRLMVGITHCDDKETFKISIDYWFWLGKNCVTGGDLYKIARTALSESFKNVRNALIRSMPKPEEVILIEDENGEVHKQTVEDSVESLQLYKRVKDTLVFFTKLDPVDTCKIIKALVAHQGAFDTVSYKNLGTLCWSVGAVSGVLDTTQERDLFICVLKTLLDLCNRVQGRSNRAIVASNVMYVTGEYDGFLNNHPIFLRTVVKKVIDFMKETFEGVQDMAVDTLWRLTRHERVSRKMVESSDQQTEPLLVDLTRKMDDYTSLLDHSQTYRYLEAVGNVLKVSDSVKGRHETGALLAELMQGANGALKRASLEAVESIEQSSTTDFIKDIVNYLRWHVAVSKTSGPVYFTQLEQLFGDFQGFYKHYMQATAQQVMRHGDDAAKYQNVKYMRTVKREILKIFEYFVLSTESEAEKEFVSGNVLPPILSLILSDYFSSVPAAKDPQVIALITAFVKRLPNLDDKVAIILDGVFDATVQLISADFQEYPEHRTNLFDLLDTLTEHCFDGLLQYASQKKDVVEGLLWGLTHTEHTVMNASLRALQNFVVKVVCSPVAKDFFTLYMHRIIKDVLLAALDKLHTSAIALHCSIFINLFAVVSAQARDTPVIGVDSVGALLMECLSQIDNLSAEQSQSFINSCLQNWKGREEEFQQMFQDFLVEMDVWGAAQENAEADRRTQADHEIMMKGLRVSE